MYSYSIVYVRLQQIIFQYINTSWHPHIKNINFCHAQIPCSEWKTSSDQNNTVVQSMLSVNQFKRLNLNLQVYYYVCLTFAILVRKNIENK